MRIGFDVDGVLADFNTSFIERCIEVTGKDLFPPRPFEIPTWHYPQLYGYTEAEMDFVNGPVWGSVKSDPTFWRFLPGYDWTPEVLDALRGLQNNGHDIYFVTDRAGVNPKRQTEDFLRALGFHFPTVLISGKKALVAEALRLDLYVDDRFENAVSVGQGVPACKTFLLNRPWNALMPSQSCTRIDSPLEVFSLIPSTKSLAV